MIVIRVIDPLPRPTFTDSDFLATIRLFAAALAQKMLCITSPLGGFQVGSEEVTARK
jgi:hypothetical protein